MKRLLLAVGCLLFPLLLFGSGQSYTVESVPNIQRSDRTRLVSDPDGILDPATVYRLDTMLYRLKTSGKAQVAVVLLGSIGDQTCPDFANRLFARWRIGEQGKDNGLLILMVRDQRCMWFETGYGLEGTLPDALLRRIQLKHMNPALGRDDWDTALWDGVSTLVAILDEQLDASGEMQRGRSEEAFPLWVLLFVVVLPLAISYAAYRRTHRCPQCKKSGTLEVEQTETLTAPDNDTITEFQRLRCRNCGHQFTRRTTRSRNDSHHGPGGMGGFLGGFGAGGFGRGFGGGGGFGGGFGGGSSGGGGAGGRF